MTKLDWKMQMIYFHIMCFICPFSVCGRRGGGWLVMQVLRQIYYKRIFWKFILDQGSQQKVVHLGHEAIPNFEKDC